MSGNDKVIWTEGMFLQPQHFQQHDRYLECLIDGRIASCFGYGWGYTSLEIDAAALTLGKVRIAAARGVFPDGTPFDFPNEDPAPIPVDIDASCRDELIVLALPLRRINTNDVLLDSSQQDELARYSAGEGEIKDSSSTSNNSTTVQLGRLRLRLMRARDLTAAYTTLGVVQVVERRADNHVLLRKAYIPPTLKVHSDPVLAGYARELHGLLHQRGETLATRVSHPGRGGVSDIADFLMLQTINRYQPLFGHYAKHSLLHPERLYASCLQLAGELATFSRDERRPQEYPEYQHDALELCFLPLITDVRRSFSMELKVNALPIELQERSHGVRTAMIHDPELLKSASFVLAVHAQMAEELLRTRFPTQVKIGPVEAIRNLVNLQLPGIALHALPVAPRQIPFHAGFCYFRLEHGGELWKQLERSGGAIAVHIAGDFPGIEMEFWAIRD